MQWVKCVNDEKFKIWLRNWRHFLTFIRKNWLTFLSKYLSLKTRKVFDSHRKVRGPPVNLVSFFWQTILWLHYENFHLVLSCRKLQHFFHFQKHVQGSEVSVLKSKCSRFDSKIEDIFWHSTKILVDFSLQKFITERTNSFW